MTKSPEQLISEMHSDITEIKTVLLGVPTTDSKGLCGEVKMLRADVNHFKRNFWILVGMLCSSGVLGTGIYQLLR